MRIHMFLENCTYPKDVRVRREAEELTRAGHCVTIIAPRGPDEPRREIVEGVAVRRFFAPSGRGAAGYVLEYGFASMAFLLGFVSALRSRVDVVHIHNPPDIFFPLAWLARRLGRRCVYDHHDSAPELFAEKFGHVQRVDRLLRACRRRTVALADYVLTVNAGQRRALIDDAHADPEKVVIVRNFPPAAHLAASSSSRFPRGPALLGYVGELAEQDGVLELPDLLLRTQVPSGEVRLRIIGDGPARAGIVARAHQLGVEDRIEFTGWVCSDDVSKLLADVDICVDPAPDTPSNRLCTMVKIADYLAAGRPVVARDLPETRWQVRDAGYLVASDAPDVLARAVSQLLSDPGRYAQAAASARQRARQLVWERSAPSLLNVYDRLEVG